MSPLRPHHPLLPLLAGLALIGCGGGGGGTDAPSGSTQPVVSGNVLDYPFLGTKRVLFLVVEYLDEPALFASTPDGLSQVQRIADTVSDAYRVDSNGRLQLEIDIPWPPLLIPRRASEYDPETSQVHIRADALRAAKLAGVAVSSYDREVIFSAKLWNGAAAHGWVRTAWMSNTLERVVVHEIGHTIGRPHADFWDGDPLGPGTLVRYGDLFDPMGTGQLWNRFLHSSAPFKLRSGWIQQGDILSVTQSGTYQLAPLETPGIGLPSALRIRRDNTSDYWVYQRATEPTLADGAVIQIASSNPFDDLILLDMNQGSPGDEAIDARLAPGEVFDDLSAGGISIENVTKPGDPITLAVTLDPLASPVTDVVPIVDVLSPPREDPVSGVVKFAAAVDDPEVGSLDGDGIDHVVLSILDAGFDPPSLVTSRTVSAPPFEFTLDTEAAGLRDGFYIFQVDAVGTDGGSNRIWYRVLLDNYSKTLP
ncbi:MAG TPA: hypothetical protein ENJ09_03350 [Planctomycetes bacterium]|nr:hypothetical protein [Planctomycetota bacterium]